MNQGSKNIENELAIISNWLNTMNLVVYWTKTKDMVISLFLMPQDHHLKDLTTVTCNNRDVYRVNELKQLHIIMANTFN